MKQTAVEWFISQLEEQGDFWENVSMGRIQISIKVQDYLELKNQAEQMEKEQIKDAYWDGGQDVPLHGKQCEHYYNETYKQPKP